jgi:hypothetical protein
MHNDIVHDDIVMTITLPSMALCVRKVVRSDIASRWSLAVTVIATTWCRVGGDHLLALGSAAAAVAVSAAVAAASSLAGAS